MTDHFKKDELAWFYQKPVLIAEDNMVAQKLLKKQLEKMGFIVESANNGEEAVQLWQERPRNYFCLGFFDHHMPKVNNTFVSITEDEKKKS
jgi:CheY-like chemotaxis protein